MLTNYGPKSISIHYRVRMISAIKNIKRPIIKLMYTLKFSAEGRSAIIDFSRKADYLISSASPINPFTKVFQLYFSFSVSTFLINSASRF